MNSDPRLNCTGLNVVDCIAEHNQNLINATICPSLLFVTAVCLLHGSCFYIVYNLLVNWKKYHFTRKKDGTGETTLVPSDRKTPNSEEFDESPPILITFGYLLAFSTIFLYCAGLLMWILTTFLAVLGVLIAYPILLFFSKNSSVNRQSMKICYPTQLVCLFVLYYLVAIWTPELYYVYDADNGVAVPEHVEVPIYRLQIIEYRTPKLATISNMESIHVQLTKFAQYKAYTFLRDWEKKKLICDKVKMFHIDMLEFEEPDCFKYDTLNQWFVRPLKKKNPALPYTPNNLKNRSLPPDAASKIVSPADCRVMVFPSLSEVNDWWIKGEKFNVKQLLDEENSNVLQGLKVEDLNMAIYRLAPQDYHKYHMPISGKIVKIHSVAGNFFSVGWIALREGYNKVLENNRRDIVVIDTPCGRVFYVIIGATVVGSINYDESFKVGKTINVGDLVGEFRYGGSTVAVLHERKHVRLQQKFLDTSSKSVESKVNVLDHIGTCI